jgi:hypothetical protein
VTGVRSVGNAPVASWKRGIRGTAVAGCSLTSKEEDSGRSFEIDQNRTT